MSAMMDAIKKAQLQQADKSVEPENPVEPDAKPVESEKPQTSQDETLVVVLTKALEMAKKSATEKSATEPSDQIETLKNQIETLKTENASLAETVKETAKRNKELIESNNKFEKELDNLQAITMDLTVDPKSIPEGIVQDHYDGVQDKAAALFNVIGNFNELTKTNPALADPQTFINVIKAITVAPC